MALRNDGASRGWGSKTDIVHSLTATVDNVHDVTETQNLLHCGETVMWGDAGYQGVQKWEENQGLEVEWRWRCVRVVGGYWNLRVRRAWRVR